MSSKLIMRQSYRLYMAAVGVLGVWSLLGITTTVSMNPTTLGYSWVALAVVGGVLTIGLYRTRETTFTGSTEKRQQFDRHSLSATLLPLYCLAIVSWAAVFGGWYAGLLDISTTVLGYGWLAIAAYGGILTIGLVSKHTSVVADTKNPSSNEKKGF